MAATLIIVAICIYSPRKEIKIIVYGDEGTIGSPRWISEVIP